VSSSIDSQETPKFADLEICRLDGADLPALDALMRANVPVFSEEECRTAVAMMEESLAQPEDDDPYRFILAKRRGRLVGFACYGTVPLTQGSFDLYWIAVEPAAQGRGVGQWLLRQCEADMVSLGGRLVMAETSSRSDYAPARRFYERATGFERVACIADFYRPGENKLIYLKRLTGP
jgi:ribosomal protein S18 acetylase RimI-like enzyme